MTAEGGVCSHNEWDPLEEVIVGVIDGATVPSWHVTLEATMPAAHSDLFKKAGGTPFPNELVSRAADELDAFADLLVKQGVVVRRPEPVDFAVPFSTQSWSQPGGLYAAMPRDCLLVVGDQIIEAPMAWRSRYFETNAFKPLLKHYFRNGARWFAAPKPQLRDEVYRDVSGVEEADLVLSEEEPLFDAADFVRFGRDIFVQRSNVTNEFGIEWVQRHLGEGYKIHRLRFHDDHPMHIDATILPLAPGKLLLNPDRVDVLPPIFRDWEPLYAPQPAMPPDHPLLMSSSWLSMNVLSLDPERVFVEAQEIPTLRALERWGFHPIPCDFRHVNTFGGSFHCVTLDVRRRGELQSYF